MFFDEYILMGAWTHSVFNGAMVLICIPSKINPGVTYSTQIYALESEMLVPLNQLIVCQDFSIKNEIGSCYNKNKHAK